MKKTTLAMLLSTLLLPSTYAADVPAGTTLANEQHVVRGNGAEPSTLDPTFVGSGGPGDVIVNDMFEGLVIENSQGIIIPGQAQQWETSADGLVYTFTLKAGLRWSNGEPITAADFVYAWQRAINPSTGNDTGHNFVTANIANAQEIQNNKLPVDALGIKALDTLTLEITLSKATPYFMSLMSVKTFFPLPQKVVEKYGEQWTKAEHIVTNGAYTLAKWAPNEYVEIKRNAAYWDNNNTVINKVTYLGLSSQSAELMRYKSGEIDITNRVQLEYYQHYMKESPEQVKAQALLGSYVYAFNSKRAPFDDLRVRKALSMAIDRDVLVEKVTGQGEPKALSVVPTTIPEYQSPRPDFLSLTHSESVTEAKRLLDEAGYNAAQPLEIELTYNTSDNHKKIALAIASMWKPLGVKVKLQNMEWKVYLSAKAQGDFQVARSWAFGDYPEPSSILGAFKCGAVGNESGYCDATFDALMDKASIATTQQQRYQLYAEAETLLSDAAVVIPLYHYNHTRLVRSTLKGLPENNPNGNIYAKDMYFVE